MGLCSVLALSLSLAAQTNPPPNPKPGTDSKEDLLGRLQPNQGGFRLAEGEAGTFNISLYAYVRYLNQKAIDDTYTDSFGRTRAIDVRNDIQIQKVKIDTKGWVLDEHLLYNLWVWTSNSMMGQGAQVVVAGNITWAFGEALYLGGGINPLPSVRSLEGTWPRMLRVDSRTIVDEYMRGSYTTGIFALGKPLEGVTYKVMLADNLSQLGIDAIQLDDRLDTFSAQLTWMPTTGEYGPGSGMGDLEQHDQIATRFGLHYTHSTETPQTQPNNEDPENTQIRLSDGTGVFDVDAFGPGTRVTSARYQMCSFDAGLKYRGFSIEAEYYFRWLTSMHTQGPVPVSRLFDHGIQVQTSYMLTSTLMGYVSGSKLFGQYGDPWDVSVGVNWYPVTRKGFERQFRINAEVMYVRRCPTGNSSVPYNVGDNGAIFDLNVEVFF